MERPAAAWADLTRLRAGAHADVILARPAAASPAALSWAHAVLDEAERASAASFAFERDRILYTFSHAFLRLTLARYLGADARALRFRRTAHGRPELAEPDGASLRFNLAHTDGLVACVVCASAACGVDVEGFARIDYRKLPARILAPAEDDALRALPAHRRRDRLLEVWTLKEAYLKARGLGLSQPLREVAFADLCAAPRCRVGPALRDDGCAWRFWSGRPTSRHRAAAAIRTDGRPATFSVFEAELQPGGSIRMRRCAGDRHPVRGTGRAC